MRVLATIEARMSATRLPGKVMLPVDGAPMLQRLVERLAGCRRVDGVKVLSTLHPADEVIETLCLRLGVPVFRGSENDVTDRILDGTAAEMPDIVVELTGDNPLVDPGLIDDAVEHLVSHGCDYVYNSLTRPVILGQNIRAFTRDALVRMSALCQDPTMRVHGGYYMECRPDLFRIGECPVPDAVVRDDIRLTVDEPADYELVRCLAERLGTGAAAGIDRILAVLDADPALRALNQNIRQKKPSEG